MTNLKEFVLGYDVENDINSVFDYQYMKLVRFLLSVLNSWPHKELGNPESRSLYIFLNFLYMFINGSGITGNNVFIFLHRKALTFFDLGLMYIALLMTWVNVSRIVTLTFSSEYRALATDFLTRFHLFHFKDNSEYSKKVHKQIHIISHRFTFVLTVQVMFGLTLFNAIPMYSNYSSGKFRAGTLVNTTFEHSLYYSYPFNTSTEIPGYIVACIFHWIISFLCASWFVVFDLFLSFLVFNVWGHFKILLYNLDNFPKPSSQRMYVSKDNKKTFTYEMYSESESEQVSVKLKECIDYHRNIVEFTDKMSTVFGPMLLIYNLFHQTSGCLLLLECSQMTAEALSKYLPLTLLVFQQLIQTSVIFELIGSTSEKIKDAVYGLPWVCMDSKNRRIVYIFLMNVQKPVHVKALGVVNVGVTSMATILKTSVSYFTFLRSM